MNLEVRRRAYIAGLLVGTPTVPLIWLARGPDDPFMQVTYPVLTLYLVAATVALWRRWLPVQGAERLMIVTIGAFYLTRLAVALHGTDDLGEVTGELTESTFWGINLVMIFSYLAFETRRALRVCLALYGVALVIMATRLVPDALRGVHLSEAVTFMRVSAFLGAGIAILYGLAHVKEQLAEERARAGALAELANTDPLTGVANRRRLEEVLAPRLAEAARYRRPLSVLLIDIDAFKALNDRFGHLAGDEVLHEAAELLTPELRSADTLGRWGGEEFLVVAPETTAEAAEQLAERCRQVFAAHRFTGVDCTVTLSIGVATLRSGDDTAGLVRRADDALYRAKRTGRNRVCVA